MHPQKISFIKWNKIFQNRESITGTFHVEFFSVSYLVPLYYPRFIRGTFKIQSFTKKRLLFCFVLFLKFGWGWSLKFLCIQKTSTSNSSCDQWKLKPMHKEIGLIYSPHMLRWHLARCMNQNSHQWEVEPTMTEDLFFVLRNNIWKMSKFDRNGLKWIKMHTFLLKYIKAGWSGLKLVYFLYNE